MAEINTRMRVTGINEYKNAMKQGQQAVKTLDAELKLNEAQYRASGDAQTYMQQKSKLLEQQIKAQKQVVDNCKKALDDMTKQGVDKASAAYQTMARDLANAQTGLVSMESAMQRGGQAAENMSGKADKAAGSLKNIDQKVSFKTVIDGLGKITSGLENAARKAVQLGQQLWENVANAASWADDENTLAAVYGIDVETLQRMQGAARTIDTPVEAIIRARQRLANAVSRDKDALKDLGVEFKQFGESEYSHNRIVTGYRDMEDIFWDVGKALMSYGDEIERDAMAQELFGRSWQELRPLFSAGREEYTKTMDEQAIVTEENVNKLNALDDALQKLDQEFQTLKSTVLAQLAPAFESVANSLSGVLAELNAYLETEEGQEKLKDLSEAVTNLFDSLVGTEPGEAVSAFSSALDELTSGLNWIAENHEGVVTAIKAIAVAFGLMKVTEGVLTFLNLAKGAKDLLSGGKGGTGDVTGGGGGVGGIGLGGTLVKAGKWIAAKAAPVAAAALPYVLPIAGTVIAGETIFRNLEKGPDNPTEAFRANEAHLYARTKASEEAQAAQIRLQDYMLMLDTLSREYEKVFTEEGSPWMEKLLDTLPQGLLTSMEDVLEKYNGGNGYIPTGTSKMLDQMLEEMGGYFILPSEPELEEGSEEKLQTQLNQTRLTVPVTPQLVGGDTGRGAASGGGNLLFLQDIGNGDRRSHANGIPYVPFDWYPAVLHRGERVLTARENARYTTNNSNLYVQNMNMSGGIDARALADTLAAAQRRANAGYGS